jgi:hypothetical protein
MRLPASTLLFIVVSASAFTHRPVTFNRDVQPILMVNCQGCHSPDHPTPTSLVTYEETAPWAPAKEGAPVENGGNCPEGH